MKKVLFDYDGQGEMKKVIEFLEQVDNFENKSITFIPRVGKTITDEKTGKPVKKDDWVEAIIDGDLTHPIYVKVKWLWALYKIQRDEKIALNPDHDEETVVRAIKGAIMVNDNGQPCYNEAGLPNNNLFWSNRNGSLESSTPKGITQKEEEPKKEVADIV